MRAILRKHFGGATLDVQPRNPNSKTLLTSVEPYVTPEWGWDLFLPAVCDACAEAPSLPIRNTFTMTSNIAGGVPQVGAPNIDPDILLSSHHEDSRRKGP